MTGSISRREFLAAAVAVSGGAVLSRPVAAQSTELCEEIETLEGEVAALEGELAELETLVEELPERKERTYVELAELYWMLREPRYPASVRETALAVGERIRESVVVLDVINEFSSGWATAWVADDGYLLTNAHNVDDQPDELACVSIDGAAHSARLVVYVEGRTPDVALLETDFDGEPIPLGSSTDLAEGDRLVQVGHPGDFGYWVIALGEHIDRQDEYDLRASVPGLAGNSGSPIVDFNGEVVAMTHGGTSEEPSETPYTGDPVTDVFAPEADTLAVPIETAVDRMESWR